MTREEFIRRAQGEVNEAMNSFRNRMWNLIEQAWAEGKRNAETEAVTKIVESAIKIAIAKLEGDELGAPITPVKECESCGSYITYIAGRPRYCPTCGCEVKWND